MKHEQDLCEGTHNCSKCGMTIKKEQTQNNSHHCFNSLAGYLQNMLASKDFVIDVFRKEISRKNTLIKELLEHQDGLERRLSRIESAVSNGQN
jgi:hypothetical protein